MTALVWLLLSFFFLLSNCRATMHTAGDSSAKQLATHWLLAAPPFGSSIETYQQAKHALLSADDKL